MRKEALSRQTRFLMVAMLSISLLTGCMGTSPLSDVSGSLASSNVPSRVVTQIINNTCGGDEDEPSEESISTGQIKGLSKVKDGFGIPYDEHADNYVNPPVPVTDDSYETNKERGIGYAGYEAHLKDTLKDGPGSHDDNDIALEYNEPGTPFGGMLTPEEEKYGCCMRWEYSALNANGGISGYYGFLTGNGTGQMQYVAIHSLKTDKWCICCPYDYGPGHNLPTAGGGKYANGRIGGVTPAVSKVLGFQEEGGCPDNALTEWWWVENSDQVKCGEVSDLSQFEQGSSESGAGSATAKVAVAVSDTILGGISRNGSEGGATTVSVAPANPNSFVDKTNSDMVTGNVPTKDLEKIVIHELVDGTEATPVTCFSSHFVIEEDGRISRQADVGQVTNHMGDDSTNASSIGVGLTRSVPGGEYPKAQLNALDRLIAYIDQQVGRQLPIECHGETASEAFPAAEYEESRNHSNVKTVADAQQAAEAGDCEDEPESENPYAGGPGIAKKAVEISGNAEPQEPIQGTWNEKPSDSRLSAYVSEKERVYNGVPGWADCGRCAATAVKASGADNSFPGNMDTAYQYAYMTKSAKWKRVGTLRTGDSPDSLCEPGDVLVTEGKGHIMIYVGNKAVKEKYSSSEANLFEGMLNKYYGWCYNQPRHAGARPYAIFRCTRPDNQSLSKKAGISAEAYVESCRQEFLTNQQTPVGWKYQEELKKVAEKKEPGCSSNSWGGQCSEFCYWNLINIGMVPGEHLPDSFVLNTFSYMPTFLSEHPDVGTLYDVAADPNFVPQAGDVAFQGRGVHFEVVASVGSDVWETFTSGGPSVENLHRPIRPEAGADKYDGFQLFFRYNWDKFGASTPSSKNTSGSGSKRTSSKKKTKGTMLGKQIAWLAVQMAPLASDQDSILLEPNICPWNKIPDARLDNEFAIMDAESEKCRNMNRAYASCCQAAVGVFAAVVDMDSLPHPAASGGPGRTAKWLRDHPDIYQKVDVQSMDDLQPGDILVNADPDFESKGDVEGNGHVAIYVGNEMAQTKFPGTKGDVYQAGYGEGIRAKYPSIDGMGGMDGFRALGYTAYRAIARNKNATIEDIDWKSLIKDPSCACPGGSDEEYEWDGGYINVSVTAS